MRVANVSGFRGVGLGKNEVPDDAKAGGGPAADKAICPVPAIKTDHNGIIFKHAVLTCPQD